MSDTRDVRVSLLRFGFPDPTDRDRPFSKARFLMSRGRCWCTMPWRYVCGWYSVCIIVSLWLLRCVCVCVCACVCVCVVEGLYLHNLFVRLNSLQSEEATDERELLFAPEDDQTRSFSLPPRSVLRDKLWTLIS